MPQNTADLLRPDDVTPKFAIAALLAIFAWVAVLTFLLVVIVP